MFEGSLEDKSRYRCGYIYIKALEENPKEHCVAWWMGMHGRILWEIRTKDDVHKLASDYLWLDSDESAA